MGRPVDAAKWVALALGTFVALNVLHRLGNIFDGLGRPGASDRLPPLPGASYPPERYAAIAERIYSAAWNSAWSEDEDAILKALAEMRNDADVVALFNAYGKRSGPLLIDGAYNLVGTVRKFLSASELAAVNAFFHSRGISAQF